MARIATHAQCIFINIIQQLLDLLFEVHMSFFDHNPETYR